MRLSADLRQLPLAGIAPERARGPERAGGVDPGGLWGFLHLGLHVWVDLRGRGRQLSAGHGSLPLRVLPPAESGKCVSSSPAVRTGSAHSGTPTVPENRIPVSVVLLEGGGGASPSLPHHGVLRHTEASMSLSPGCRALLHP